MVLAVRFTNRYDCNLVSVGSDSCEGSGSSSSDGDAPIIAQYEHYIEGEGTRGGWVKEDLLQASKDYNFQPRKLTR